MNKSLTVKQLEVLVKIYECGGISEAARQLNISPSAISKNLSGLESQLGLTLIKRTTRTLKLTEAGEYLVHRAQEILDEFEYIFNTTTGFYDHPQGELRITSSIAFGYAHLASISERFRQKNHDVVFNIDLNDHFVNLNEENYDIALRIASSPPQNFSMRKLCNIRWAYCASPLYFQEATVPTRTADLRNHKMLVYPGLTPDYAKHDNKAKSVPQLQANSSLLLLKAALGGQGIAYLPTYLIGDHIKSGQLTPVRIDEKMTYTTHNLYALYFPSKYRNPKVRTFVDFMVNELEDGPEWDEWITQR
ncbi:LysR family transcriptional regulator [Serratia marcescens]|nr:LysR family transcriptional regulator [Serratia marcescens]